MLRVTASGKLLSLSEEDLVQCDHNGDNGCKGGLMDNAFAWIEKKGIAAEAAYPYTSGARRPHLSHLVPAAYRFAARGERRQSRHPAERHLHGAGDAVQVD